MGITSLQVCMDSSDWLQGTISEDGTGMDSSPITTPTGGDDILTCSRPLIERRLRPQHEQSQKCPRCESTHTKFCYYNNYSLSQPRFFCKTCRRYWTKGGTLRNIPVGGGCRKNKKISTNKKPTSSSSSADNHLQHNNNNNNQSSSSSSLILNTINHNHNHHLGLTYNNHNQENDHNNNHTDLHLAFPEQIHFSSLHGLNPHGNLFLDNNNNPTPIDFMAHDSLIMGNGENAFGGMGQNGNFHGICAPFGGGLMSSVEHHGINLSAGGANHILESYNHHHNHHLDQINNHHEVDIHDHDVKPNKILSLEWHDHQQACNSDLAAGYNFGGLGSWTGLMNGYGSSATNPLV